MGRGEAGRASRGGCEAVWEPLRGEGQGWGLGKRRRRLSGGRAARRGPLAPAVASHRGGLSGLPLRPPPRLPRASPLPRRPARCRRAAGSAHSHTLTSFLTMTLSAFRSACGDESRGVEPAQCPRCGSTPRPTGGATPHCVRLVSAVIPTT